MLIPVWFAIAYPLSIMFFFLVLYGCSKQYPKRKHYSILSRTISGLGNKKYKSSRLFKEDFVFMPFLNLILVYFLILFLLKNNLPLTSAYFLAIGELAALGTSFATEDFRNKIKLGIHYVVSVIAFVSSIIGFVILSFALKNVTSVMMYFGFLPLAFGVMAGISFVSNKKHPCDVKEPVLKNISLWEWLTFFSLFLCLSVTYILLIVF